MYVVSNFLLQLYVGFPRAPTKVSKLYIHEYFLKKVGGDNEFNILNRMVKSNFLAPPSGQTFLTSFNLLSPPSFLKKYSWMYNLEIFVEARGHPKI